MWRHRQSLEWYSYKPQVVHSHQELGEKHEDSSPELQEGMDIANISSSGSCPSELWEICLSPEVHSDLLTVTEENKTDGWHLDFARK